MHFQRLPHNNTKLLSWLVGEVLDVLADLQAGPAYGRAASVRLSAENAHSIYIPSGIAYGFLAVLDGSLMVYKTSTEHVPSHDDVDLMKQLADVTLVEVSTEDVDAAVAVLDYCISLISQREVSCSATGRLRCTRPISPLMTSGHGFKKLYAFT